MAGMVPYQELLQLLRHRDAELARLRELCQGKDTTVDFLKTKIVTLQNQARAAFSERGDHPAAEVQELQQRLQQSLEAQDAALRRQEELSLELQHAALEVDDLRAELKQARVEVGRLEAELQKVQLENQVQAHNGVPKESVLLAVEELERELAQDLTKTEVQISVVEGATGSTACQCEVEPLNQSPSSGAEEYVQACTSMAFSIGCGKIAQAMPEEENCVEAEPEETEEPKAEPKPAEPKVLSAPEVPVHSLDLMQARSQDSDAEPQAAEPASDEALEERSLLDSCRSVTSPEHSQAEHSQGPAELTEVHVSASGALLNLFDSSEDSAALAAKRERMARQMERRRQARAPRGQRAEEARRAAPAKREEAPWSAGARSGAQTARNPNSVRPGEIMEFPKATASSPEDEPQAVKDPEPQATPAAQEAPRPTPCQPAGPQAGPTLHARFEGLRDEMKRRRSQHSQHLHAQSRLAAPLEAGAVAEAKTSTASQPSQPSFVPAETPRSRSPEALTASASFTPGQVSPTSARARVPHIGGRSLPHLGLLAGGPSMVTSCRTTGSLSPGGRNYRDDVGWWASGSGSMSVTATPRVCGFTWREDAPVVLSSSVAVPGDLDRSRRHLTYSRSMSLSASSSASALARPAAEDHDVLHDAVQRFCAQQPLRFPLSRVSRGVYLYGNKKLLMALHNGKLMVRVGSGFKTLESCIGETRGHEQVHSMRRMSRT
ncbi:unnamed protein product [Effrenium voratum]|uniref:GAR domain-containing protein n=1 Tax=Effrenium voratum TaxID=2562239 RepID=A0AA36MYE1_9DINO|nr:unnamed protein product [Effrenium voratum]